MTKAVSKMVVPVMASVMIALSPGIAAAGDGEALYNTKTCFTCHGKDGKTPIMPGYPNIAGQDKAYVSQQMKDIKSGARNNGQSGAMKGVMGLVSEEEIEAIADYVASMAP